MVAKEKTICNNYINPISISKIEIPGAETAKDDLET